MRRSANCAPCPAWRGSRSASNAPCSPGARSPRPSGHMADVVALFALLAAVHGGVATASVRPDTAAQAHEAHGTVQTDSFWSQALGVHKHVEVYLPPSYADHPDRRYPV